MVAAAGKPFEKALWRGRFLCGYGLVFLPVMMDASSSMAVANPIMAAAPVTMPMSVKTTDAANAALEK